MIYTLNHPEFREVKFKNSFTTSDYSLHPHYSQITHHLLVAEIIISHQQMIGPMVLILSCLFIFRSHRLLFPAKKNCISGWWLTYPSKKKCVSWEGWHPISELENKSHVPNHQPDFFVETFTLSPPTSDWVIPIRPSADLRESLTEPSIRSERGRGIFLWSLGQWENLKIWYPLVMTNIAMENHLFLWTMASMAMLNNQRLVLNDPQ